MNDGEGTEKPQKERRRKWKHAKAYHCATCDRDQPFCWSCPCGFMICSDCMEENFWGMTCNGITWTCTDCGAEWKRPDENAEDR